MLETVDVILRDKHFVYTSGRHGAGYVNMDRIFPDTETLSLICQKMIKPFLKEDFDTLVGAATGGILLAGVGALSTNSSKPSIKAIWADKDGKNFIFNRAGFTKELTDKKILIVEDVLTTGGSVEKVCRAAEAHGATIIGVSAIVNSGGVTAEMLHVPCLEALVSLNFKTFDPINCPLCASAIPIVEDIGHGEEYKYAHPDYQGGYIKLAIL